MRPTPEQSCTLWLIASWEDTFADSQWDSGEPVHHLQPNHYARAPAAPNGSGGQPSPYVLVGDSGSTSYDSTTNSGLLVMRVALLLRCRGVQHSCRWLFGLLPRGPTLP